MPSVRFSHGSRLLFGDGPRWYNSIYYSIKSDFQLKLVVAKFSSKSEHSSIGNSEAATKKIETNRESNELGSQKSSLCCGS